MSPVFSMIRVRFLLVMIVGCTTFSVAAAVVAGSELRAALHTRTLANTAAQLVAHADIVAERVLVDDEVGARSLLVGVVETNPDWTGLDLLRPGKPAVRAIRQGTAVLIAADESTPPGFPVRAPILDGHPGALIAWVSTDADDAAAVHGVERLLGLLVVLSLGGISAAALLGHWLTASLVTMAVQVRKLGEGKLIGEFPVPPGEGEVTVLAQAFRETVARLAEARVHLEANQRRMIEVEKLAAVGSLAAGVAHEVANPIAGAAACLRRLGRSEIEPERRAEYVSLATEALDRAGRVLRELLAYARPGIEGPAAVEVRAVVEAATRLVASSAGCEVSVVRGPDVQASWPRQQVDQVLTNLLLNATQAAATRVTAGWTTRDDLVIIEITDDGPGIPPEVRTHMFEPFFTTRPVGQGTGLGLSVSLALANTMGGWIGVDSIEGRPGTVVRFAIPSTVLERTHVA
jgi:signal transduction histidine kinase